MARLMLPALVLGATLNACNVLTPNSNWGTAEARDNDDDKSVRAETLARAQVWTRTDVASKDIAKGPGYPGALPFRSTVECDYLPKELSGASPKFACRVGENDELKVKYGGTNAEVYAEVVATRLFWALGFGADGMYPVRVVCNGCPQELAGIARDSADKKKQWIFDPATIERKLPAREFAADPVWSWKELEAVKEEAGGAPLAHRDALKLLAVFVQHTDSKPGQQRIVCLDPAPEKETRCARPFLMVSDLGLTFGRANMFNVNPMGMNLLEWAETPVWKEKTGCVGNLRRSVTGTLEHPIISEAGRQFLASLLMQLSDEQIRDLFETARVHLRVREPRKAKSGFATVDEWVGVFKAKRDEIVARRC